MTSYTGRPAARDQDARDGREAYTVTWQAVRWPVAMPVARRPVPCAHFARANSSRVECVSPECLNRAESKRKEFSVRQLGTVGSSWLAHAQTQPGGPSPPWLCLWLTRSLPRARLCCGDPPAAAHWPPLWETPQPPLTHACRQLTRTSLAVRCYSCPMQALPPPSSAWRSGSRRSPRRARC
jgi:hypothetical protein